MSESEGVFVGIGAGVVLATVVNYIWQENKERWSNPNMFRPQWEVDGERRLRELDKEIEEFIMEAGKEYFRANFDDVVDEDSLKDRVLAEMEHQRVEKGIPAWQPDHVKKGGDPWK